MAYEELITDCIEGKAKSQKELYNLLSGKMMTVCLRYLNNKEEAEDVFQMAFVKVFKSLKDYQQNGSFEGWVRRIFVNCCLDQIRKNKKWKNDYSLNDLDVEIGKSDFIIEKMSAEVLMEELNKMPQGYRVVFNLYAIEGYSHKEIADELGVAESTSKSQYKRSREYMMNILKKMKHERS